MGASVADVFQTRGLGVSACITAPDGTRLNYRGTLCDLGNEPECPRASFPFGEIVRIMRGPTRMALSVRGARMRLAGEIRAKHPVSLSLKTSGLRLEMPLGMRDGSRFLVCASMRPATPATGSCSECPYFVQSDEVSKARADGEILLGFTGTLFLKFYAVAGTSMPTMST